MLLSAVSVLVVARSSSEIPEGLMNKPVYVCVCVTQRHVAAKVGTSKGGGKQWLTTPKTLPRMQCAKNYIGSITGFWFLPDRPLELNTNE